MIISEQKRFEEILASIRTGKSVFIIGCGDCATSCGVGGEKEVSAMAAKFTANGINVSGTVMVDTGCDERLIRRDLKKSTLSVDDVILVLACGSGVQAVSSIVSNDVVPGLNSLFLGKIKNLTSFDQVCSMCGDCILAHTGNICPITRCPKKLLNGPCGGSSEGKCEVNRDNDCAWTLIYERLKKLDKLDYLRSYQPPKDNSKLVAKNRYFTRKEP